MPPAAIRPFAVLLHHGEQPGCLLGYQLSYLLGELRLVAQRGEIGRVDLRGWLIWLR